MNVTEHFVGNLLNHFITAHVNVTSDLDRRLGNITEEVVTGLINGTDDVGVCDFIISNVTSGNVTTTVTSYDPAACGVYGLYPELKPLLIIILVCYILLAIFGNGCLAGVIITEENLQEPGNIFLCALAFTDVFHSLTYTPSAIYSLAHGEAFGGDWCRAQAFFEQFQSTSSIYLLAGLWICRYVHIAHPYKYQTLLKPGRLALAMAVCFLIALAPPLIGLARVGEVSTLTVDLSTVDIAEPLSLMMPCVPGGPEGAVIVSLCLIGVIISCCFAGLIFREARNSHKKHDQKRAWQAQADKLENKLKAIKTLGIVVGVQWVTYIPVITVAFLGQFRFITVDTFVFYGDIVFLISQTSTFTDSIVYAFRNKIYRRGLAKLYRKVRNAINNGL